MQEAVHGCNRANLGWLSEAVFSISPPQIFIDIVHFHASSSTLTTGTATPQYQSPNQSVPHY